MSDQIKLTGISGFGYHGVLESERANGQNFRSDVTIFLNTRTAGETDDLNNTINYAEVANLVHEFIVGEPVQLLETLAEKIASAILAGYQLANSVEVTIHKPEAPISIPFLDVSVTIQRSR